MSSDFFPFIQTIHPLSNQAKEALAAIVKKVVLKKGETLLEEGKICHSIYFVENGCLRSFYNLDGKEVTYWISMAGMFASSFSSFIAQIPSHENIHALEDSSLIAIHINDLTQLYHAYHEIETLGRKLSEKYYIQLEERTFALQFLSAKDRYEKLVNEHPNLLQKVSLGHLASYLGITQETLSRIRGKA